MNRYHRAPKFQVSNYYQRPLIWKWVYNLLLLPYPYKFKAQTGRDFKYIIN